MFWRTLAIVGLLAACSSQLLPEARAAPSCGCTPGSCTSPANVPAGTTSLDCTGLTASTSFPNAASYSDTLGDISIEESAGIPADLFSANPKVRTLSINFNQVVSIPESISSLTELEFLFIDHNAQLESLPDGLTDLRKLTTIFVNFNGVTSLPEGIGALANLEFASLSYNALTSIPSSIETPLRNGLDLDLSYNKLTSLPDVFGIDDGSDGGVELDLSGNLLTELPESIGMRTTLEWLAFYDNQITSLPWSFTNLRNVSTFGATGNPLCGPQPDLSFIYYDNSGLLYLPEEIPNECPNEPSTPSTPSTPSAAATIGFSMMSVLASLLLASS